jgi:NitT/TauT family transport system substrate-binding protein
MRFTRASRLAPVATGLAAALLASACSSSPASTKTTAPEQMHISVAVVPIVDAAPYFLAVKKGYFKQEGLIVKTEVVAQSTLALPALLSGSVQIVTAANYVSFLAAQAKGVASLSIVAPNSTCGTNTESVLAMPGSKIKGAAGLAHKTIAVNINPNIQTLQISAVLKANNVNPATVTYVPITFADMPAALKAGRVDAISEVEPFITKAETTLGAVPVLQQCVGPTANDPLGGNFATAAWVKQNPQAALAFQRGMEKGNALADSDRAAVEQIIPTFIKGITPQEAALISLDNFPTTQDATQIQRIANLMESGGMLKKPLEVAPLMFH